MQSQLYKNITTTARAIYRDTGLRSLLNKTFLGVSRRFNHADSLQKQKAATVYLSYNNIDDAERYGELVQEIFKDLPLNITNVICMTKAYPPPRSIAFVGISLDGSIPGHALKLSAVGIKYLTITIEKK